MAGTRRPTAASNGEPEKQPDQPDMIAEAKKAFAGELPKGIHQKLNMILRSLPNDMRPEGNNSHFHYAYWTLDQIGGHFRNRFAELDLSFMADVETYDVHQHETSKGGISFLTTLIIRFTITDSETGENVSGRGIGQGDDPGDKGANKAFSSALKYWLLKAFVVGGDDSEADESTDDRNDSPSGGGRPSRRRAASSRSRSRDRDEGDNNVVITDSNIEGIQRGGRSSHSTEAQIKQIRVLARELEWNATGAARRISEWVGDDLEMPENVEEHADALLRYLDSLSADDAGMIVTKMVELRDTPDEDDDDDPSTGYGN